MPSIKFNDGVDDAANESFQLPEGWYPGHLVNSYFKDFKSGNGVSLVFEIQVSHKGRSRKLMSFNTWKHKTSPEAEKWGQVAVKQFFRACGKPEAQSTEECHNMPLEVKVIEGEKFNQIKGYRRLGGPPRAATVVDEAKIEQQKKDLDDDDIPF